MTSATDARGGELDLSAGPRVRADGVDFVFPDASHRLAGVNLVQEVVHPRTGPMFAPTGDGQGWAVHLPRPPVRRMEYLLELLHPDGGTELVLDPGNPLAAPGPFGPKSVIEFPDYRPPTWVEGEATGPAEPTPPGDVVDLGFDSADLGGPMHVRIWSSAGAGAEDRLPLLVANDGIEYAELSGLVAALDRLTADGTLPPMRAALLHPVRRDEHYSASPVYARVLTQELLPFLHRHAPVAPGRHMRVGMGASLGGLAMLHAHREHPSTFGGLLLQSASLFHHRYDRYELGFEHFARIRRFMDRVHAQRGGWTRSSLPIPVAMTCGAVEMNLANNRAASLVLRAQGYDVALHVVPDAHNWIGWRDAWDPALITLLRTLWL